MQQQSKQTKPSLKKYIPWTIVSLLVFLLVFVWKHMPEQVKEPADPFVTEIPVEPLQEFPEEELMELNDKIFTAEMEIIMPARDLLFELEEVIEREEYEKLKEELFTLEKELWNIEDRFMMGSITLEDIDNEINLFTNKINEFKEKIE